MQGSTRIVLDTIKQDEENQETSLSLDQKKKVASMTLLGHQVLGNAKQALNYSIANIGNFTGNYITQNRVQLGASIIGDVATIGLGFATGPVGGAIAVMSVAVSKSLQAVSFFQDIKHQENQANYLRERSGNTLINGSRGTEN